jgi:hypothetical protein
MNNKEYIEDLKWWFKPIKISIVLLVLAMLSVIIWKLLIWKLLI